MSWLKRVYFWYRRRNLVCGDECPVCIRDGCWDDPTCAQCCPFHGEGCRP